MHSAQQQTRAPPQCAWRPMLRPPCRWQQLAARPLRLQQCSIAAVAAAQALGDVQQQQEQVQQKQHKQDLPQHAAAGVPEWPGLRAWRARGINSDLVWGDNNKPAAVPVHQLQQQQSPLLLADSLVGVALQVLGTAEPSAKAAITHAGWSAYCQGRIPLHLPEQAAQQLQQAAQQQQPSSSSSRYVRPPDRPARPQHPQLVIPKHVPSPKDSPLPLAAHMLHNLAHIELNAIDLAMDTVARFAHLRLPDGFYEDFARVADDESRHFRWCSQRLAELGHAYGDMVAHDLLWAGAQDSAGDLGARLAIVPLSQEARGLDAGQRLVERLVGAGDRRSASVVAQIAAEERAHVAVGVVWFRCLCAAMDAPAPAAFRAWLAALAPDLLKGPFNHHAREEVGLSREWYDVSHWPAEQQQQLVRPAAAAAAKGQGQHMPLPPVPAAAAGAAAGAFVVPCDAAALEQLRQRLWGMLQVEAAAC